MISPELLRRYPFFGPMDDSQLKALAMLAEVLPYGAGETVFDAQQEADALYFLLEGGVDLSFVVEDPTQPGMSREFHVSPVNPGEPFGISALLEPYRYGATIRTSVRSQVLKIQSAGLRALCELDPRMDSILMRQIAKAAFKRLQDTRAILVAARA